MSAEMSRQQQAMMKAWMEASTQMWMGAMFPWLGQTGRKGKK